MLDRYEAIELLQSLVRLARNESHLEVDEYAAAQDEIMAGADSFLDDLLLPGLFLGL